MKSAFAEDAPEPAPSRRGFFCPAEKISPLTQTSRKTNFSSIISAINKKEFLNEND